MRKWAILSALVVATIVGSTLLLQRPSRGASNEPSPEATDQAEAAALAPTSADGKTAPVAIAPAEVSARTRAPAAADAENGVSEDEQAVLEMYEEMTDAMTKHASDCRAMAESVRFAISAHEEDVRRVLALAANRGAEEARAADERLEAIAGPQMARFRASINKELQRCGSELMPVLRQLSEMNGEAAR